MYYQFIRCNYYVACCCGWLETILGGLPTSAAVVEIDAGLARHHAAAPLWSDEEELERRPHPETDARGLKLDHQFISREGEKCGEFPKLLTSDVASNLNLVLEIQFWQFTMSGGSGRRRGREEERLPVSCSGVSLLKRYAATPFGSGHRTLELRCWDLRTCKTSSISGAHCRSQSSIVNFLTCHESCLEVFIQPHRFPVPPTRSQQFPATH